MDFSDPLQPKITREFTGVTATGQDRTRGLIFIANGDGIWILHQRVGVDPAVEKEYDRYHSGVRSLKAMASRSVTWIFRGSSVAAAMDCNPSPLLELIPGTVVLGALLATCVAVMRDALPGFH